jgi:stage V sporulation protein R
MEDPSIGIEKVEAVLEAAHALAIQCRRNLAIKKLSREEEWPRVLGTAQPPTDPFQGIHKRQAYSPPDMHKVPLSPEEDLLLFIRDHNPYLSEWEKDLLTIVHERERYFIPQIETKIMNEGWASFWHREIMNSLQLPPRTAPGISRAPQPGGAAVPPRVQSLLSGAEIVGRYQAAPR